MYLLLEEVWIKIFAYLDPHCRQNIASIVCKDWLNIIRNDCRLSGHLTLKRFIYFADVNSMLRNNWPKLKVSTEKVTNLLSQLMLNSRLILIGKQNLEHVPLLKPIQNLNHTSATSRDKFKYRALKNQMQLQNYLVLMWHFESNLISKYILTQIVHPVFLQY